jgi:hypothetical protein
MMRQLLIAITIMLLCPLPSTRASHIPQPVPFDKECPEPPDGNWTPAESFVWQNVCVGEVGKFDLNDAPEKRTLRSLFLEEILLKDKYRLALTRRGVYIDGATFTDRVDLHNAVITHDLLLNACTFKNGVDFSGLKSTYGLTLIDSHVDRFADMSNLHIDMELKLQNNNFDSIKLEGAHIGGSLDFNQSKVAKRFNADTIDVGGAVYLNEGAEFHGVIDLSFAKIYESLNFHGGTFFAAVNVNGTQIGNELYFGSPDGKDPGEDTPANWQKGSLLSLHNARANVIPNLLDPWPESLNLNGFSYRSLGAGGAPEDTEVPLPSIEKWFERQRRYSAQPYEQLAQVFQNHGAIERATDIRYLSRDRERADLKSSWKRYIWLSMVDNLIGYGYFPDRAIKYAAIIVLLGATVFVTSGGGRLNGMPYGLAYSFDMLLPIVRLREMHYQIDLKGWARYYFYLHKIAGWVLVSFLIAAVSGLTK